MTKRRLAGIAFIVYVAAIAGSNWLIGHVGIPVGHGTHLTPVGFGLMAPSGVWAAAISFPARDLVQRTAGRWLGIVAILAGAALSWWLSDPTIAIASGVTYLCSESLDMAIYSPLQRRWFVPAVFVSGCGALVLDSVLFLHLAGIYSASAAEGLMLGKFWVILTAAGITWSLRKSQSVAVPA